MNIIFSSYKVGDTLEEGKYLIKYFDGDNSFLPDYMTAYFKNGHFYQEASCPEKATLDRFFKYIPFEYVFLPNLQSKDGKYLNDKN